MDAKEFETQQVWCVLAGAGLLEKAEENAADDRKDNRVATSDLDFSFP